MGRKCEFANCRNVSGLFPGRRTFHGFPKDAALCRRWVANCCNPDVSAEFQNFGPNGLKRRKICSDHFLETELTTGLARRPIPGAVPRIISHSEEEISNLISSNDDHVHDCSRDEPNRSSYRQDDAPDESVVWEEVERSDESQPTIQFLQTDESNISEVVSWTDQDVVDRSHEQGGAPDEADVWEFEWLDESQPTIQFLQTDESNVSEVVSWTDQDVVDRSHEQGGAPDEADVWEFEWLDESQPTIQFLQTDESNVSDAVSWTDQDVVDRNHEQDGILDEAVVWEEVERSDESQPTIQFLQTDESNVSDTVSWTDQDVVDRSHEQDDAPDEAVVREDETVYPKQLEHTVESKMIESLRADLRENKRKLFVRTQTSNRRLVSNKKLERENALLKKEVKRLNSVKSQNEKLGVRARRNPIIHDSLRNATRKPRGRRYHAATMKFAAGTYITGARTYRYIQSTTRLTLPHKNSIYNYNRHIRIGPGINQHLLLKSQRRVQQFKNEQDRIVTISCDGMNIKQDLSYNAKADEFHGFENDGSYRKCEKNNPMKLASEAVAVMVNGLYKPFKQPIGYMLVHNSPGSDHQWEFITECVRAVRKIGLIPLVLTMDQCSTNVKMCREHGMTTDAPFVQIDDDQLAIMFDTPHLIKNARNAIFKHNAVFGDKIASYDHLKQLYQRDTQGELRLVPKLVQKAIELPPFVAMSVPMAVRVMSSSTGSGIRHYVNTGEMPQEALHTADFVELHDKTFDIFNSKEKFSESIGKPLRMPITDTSTHFDELEIILETFKSMFYTVNSCCDVSKARKESKTLTSAQRQPNYLKGLIGNIIALKWLWNILRNKYKCKYMCTNPLCQDCLENFFSEIRRRCGFNEAPNSFHFGCAFKYASISITEKKFGSHGKNCQADNLQPLLTENDFDDYKPDRSKQTITITEEPLDLSSPLEVLSKETNALVFILGASVTKIPHAKCKKMLIAKSDDECLLSTDYDFVKVKQSSSARTLVLPNNALYNVGMIAFVAFRQKFRKFLYQRRIGVKTRLKQYIKYDRFDKGVCKQCFTKVIDSIYNTLIAGFLKKTRLELKQANTKKRLLKRNRKANRMNLPA